MGRDRERSGSLPRGAVGGGRSWIRDGRNQKLGTLSGGGQYLDRDPWTGRFPAEPAGVLVQVPAAPARLQASQAPAQAVLQHTPSTQFPLPHSLATWQAAPRAFFGRQQLARMGLDWEAPPLPAQPSKPVVTSIKLIADP